MADLSRRSVLKGMTKMSMAAAAAPLMPWISGCCRNNYENVTLNVVLHGLFVLNITDSGLELLTPDVKDHIHRVGGWDIRQVYDLEPGGRYELRGTKTPAPTTFPTPIGACGVNISHQDYLFSVDPTQSLFSVKLPIPDAVYLLRCVSAQADATSKDDQYGGTALAMAKNDRNAREGFKRDQTPPSGRSKASDGGYGNKCVDITQLSLCQSLVYQGVPNSCDLELFGSCWKPKVNDDKKTINLHFWAEPEKKSTPKHADEAYARLQMLLPPLSLNLKVYTTAPLEYQPVVPGLPVEQEQGWADWASGGAEGTRPTNCCTVMVTKTPIVTTGKG